MSIDWSVIRGQETNGAGTDLRLTAFQRAAETFTPAQTKTALAKIKTLPGGDKTPTFWPVASPMPDASDMDFGKVQQVQVPLSSLLASNGKLSKTKLTWHVQHPGQSENPSIFTTSPIIIAGKAGNVILDGQHRLAAMQLLGQTTWKCWLVQTN